MKNDKIKIFISLITYTVLLIYCIFNFQMILKYVKNLLSLFSPLFIGLIIAFIFNRPFEFFHRFYEKKLQIPLALTKTLAITTVYICFFGAVILIVFLILPQLGENIRLFSENINYYLSELEAFLDQITSLLHIQEIDLSDLNQHISFLLESLISQIDNIAAQIWKISESIVSALILFGMGMIFATYLLFGKQRLLGQFKKVINCFLSEKTNRFLIKCYDIVFPVFEDYIIGQCKEALILGTLCFIGMKLLRLDYAALISVNIALTALVPILGAYVGGFIGIALLMFISPRKALLFLIFLIILQQIEGNFIYPKVVGRSIGLPSMWVLLAIYVGAKWKGIIGMLIGVPLAAIIYRLIREKIYQKSSASQLSLSNHSDIDNKRNSL